MLEEGAPKTVHTFYIAKMSHTNFLFCYFHILCSPNRWSTTLFCLEEAVELCTGCKTTFYRNDVVVIFGIFLHHLFGCMKANIAEPYSECGFQTLVEELSQFIFGDIQ